jgi:pyruvyltransferase
MEMKLFWYRDESWSAERGNVGDTISPYLVERLSGEFPEYAEHGGGRFVVVGSVVQMLQDGDIIWGAGLIRKQPVRFRANVSFCAVRGPLTRKMLLRSGYPKAAVPEVFGDPCVLTSLLFPQPRTVQHRIGVVAHYVDQEECQRIFHGTQVRIIDVINQPETFLQAINSCEVILSSSLHGVIFSESYGINTIPIQLSDKIYGGAFKFDDYYQSTGRGCVRIRLARPVSDASLDKLIRKYKFVSPKIDRRALIRSCPFYNPALRLI